MGTSTGQAMRPPIRDLPIPSLPQPMNVELPLAQNPQCCQCCSAFLSSEEGAAGFVRPPSDVGSARRRGTEYSVPPLSARTAIAFADQLPTGFAAAERRRDRSSPTPFLPAPYSVFWGISPKTQRSGSPDPNGDRGLYLCLYLCLYLFWYMSICYCICICSFGLLRFALICFSALCTAHCPRYRYVPCPLQLGKDEGCRHPRHSRKSGNFSAVLMIIHHCKEQFLAILAVQRRKGHTPIVKEGHISLIFRHTDHLRYHHRLYTMQPYETVAKRCNFCKFKQLHFCKFANLQRRFCKVAICVWHGMGCIKGKCGGMGLCTMCSRRTPTPVGERIALPHSKTATNGSHRVNERCETFDAGDRRSPLRVRRLEFPRCVGGGNPHNPRRGALCAPVRAIYTKVGSVRIV